MSIVSTSDKAFAKNIPLFTPNLFSVPTLVIYGSNDPCILANDMIQLTQSIPVNKVELVVIDRADHNIQHGHARDELVRRIVEFCNELL